MPSITLTTMRQDVGRELGVMELIPNALFDSTAVGSITSSNRLRNALWAPTHFSEAQTVIARMGSATTADNIRFAADLTNTTGLLAHNGANYADTTVGSETVELWKWGIRPDIEPLDGINRVMRYEFDRTFMALSHLSRLDGDMALATDTNWTDVGTPTTSAKSTTQNFTPWGTRNYHLVGDAVNEGTQSATVLTRQSGIVSAYAIVAADTGTVSFQLYDVTNSAAVGTAITHSERRPQLMAIPMQSTPATSKATAVKILGTTNPSDFYIDQVWLYNRDNPKIALPTSVTASLMVISIFQAIPKYATGSNVYDGEGFELRPLMQGEDYRLVFTQGDSEPYAVWFNHPESAYSYPLFAEVLVNQADRTTFAAESDLISGEKNVLYPRLKVDWLKNIYPGKMPEPERVARLKDAEAELKAALAMRPLKSVATKLPYYATRSVY